MRLYVGLAMMVLLAQAGGSSTCGSHGPGNNQPNVSWDFEDTALTGWVPDGAAFTSGQPRANSGFSPPAPSLGRTYWQGTPHIGAQGEYLISTSDPLQGTLTSAEITLEQDHTFISALIGGSADPLAYFAIQLRTSDWDIRHTSTTLHPGPIDGLYMTVHRAGGRGDEAMTRVSFNMTEYLGYRARIKIFDLSAAGHINVDDIRFDRELVAPQPPPVWGFADLHAHQFSNLAFGGTFMTGLPFDATCLPSQGCALSCPFGTAPGAFCQMARSLPNCDYLPGGGFALDKFLGQITTGNRVAGALMPLFVTLIATTAGTAGALAGAIAPLVGPIVALSLLDPVAGPLVGAGLGTLGAIGATVATLAPIAQGGVQAVLAACTTGNSLAHGPIGCTNVAGEVMNNKSLHRTDGFPTFTDWPRYWTMSHQQIYWEWLKRAWQGGMRVMVMDAVDNQLICRIEHVLKGIDGDCSEMPTIDAQIKGAQALEQFIAANDGGWYKIVHNSAEARAAIQAGKLAVVLGIETDSLFGCAQANCGQGSAAAAATWVRAQVAHYRSMGVSKLNPVHLSNNEFGGMALYDDFFAMNSKFLTGNYVAPADCSATGVDYKVGAADILMGGVTKALLNFDYLPPTTPGTGHCNTRGLTPLGHTLIQEMMNQKMLIDVDHMSSNALGDTLSDVSFTQYPVLATHSGLNELTPAGKGERTERNKSRSDLAALRSVGSLLGVGVSSSETTAYAGAPTPCARSAASFATVYMAAVEGLGGVRVARAAVGSDMNGLNALSGPRFGPNACSGVSGNTRNSQAAANASLPVVAYTGQGALTPSVAGNMVYNVNIDGMAHMGMYPDWFQDVSNALGAVNQRRYLIPLFRSAEAFVRLWEQIDGTRPRGPDYSTGSF